MNVRQSIVGCTNCHLHKTCTKPVPYDHPLYGLKDGVCVIGEAPGKTEDVRGVSFVGASGNLLRSTLRRGGLNPGLTTYMNVVCCWPNDNGKNRQPTTSEITSCRMNFTAQLMEIRPRFVLAVGAISLASTLPIGVAGPIRVRITNTHGRWWKMPLPGTSGKSAWVMATWHPAYVLRNRDVLSKWQEELAWFAEVVDSDMQPMPDLYCVRCGEIATEHVGEVLGFCRKCAEAVGCDVEPDVSNKWVVSVHMTRVLVEAPDAETALARFTSQRGYYPDAVKVRAATVTELLEFRKRRGRMPETARLFDDVGRIGQSPVTDHRT